MIDGTPCGEDTDDICVQGQCWVGGVWSSNGGGDDGWGGESGALVLSVSVMIVHFKPRQFLTTWVL